VQVDVEELIEVVGAGGCRRSCESADETGQPDVPCSPDVLHVDGTRGVCVTSSEKRAWGARPACISPSFHL